MAQKRLNVNINDQTAAALEGYAEGNGVSVTEAVRRLVNVGDFVARAQTEGKRLELVGRRGRERVVFTW